MRHVCVGESQDKHIPLSAVQSVENRNGRDTVRDEATHPGVGIDVAGSPTEIRIKGARKFARFLA